MAQYTFTEHHKDLIHLSGKRSVREQRLHISLRVTITLGSVGLIRDLSNSLSVLWGQINLSGTHIFLEVLQSFAVLAMILCLRNLNIGLTASLVVPGMGITSSP